MTPDRHGRRRASTSCRSALALADAHDGVVRGARHPPARGGRRRGRPTSPSSRRCSPTRRRSPSARPGSTTIRDYAPHDAQRRLFEAQLALADDARQAGRDPHPRGRRRDRRRPRRRSAATVILHCFSSPALLPLALERALLRLVRRQRHLPEGAGAARGGGAGAGRPDPRRDRLPVPRAAAASAAGRTSRPTSSTRSPRSPRRGRGRRTSSAAQIDENARRRLRGCRDASRPKKTLGQHFLVDENILGVIGRLAELEPGDVVLEIGPGLGVLTALPRRPRRARPRGRDRPLARGAAPRARSPRGRTSTFIFGDALALDLAALDPRRRSSSRTCPTTSPRP